MADEHVTDDGDTKKYWTQIPNIVFDLGLKPFELVLYAHLKRAAGANIKGKCTKSTPTLARETGMGAGTISRAKTALAKRRADLNNKSLIRTRETLNPRGGKKRHEIIITDIWKENMARFASSSVEIETDTAQVPVRNDQVPEPSSPVEIKKNLLEEEPSKEKLQEARPRQPQGKPERANQEPKMKCPANILETHPEIREMFPEHNGSLEKIIFNWHQFRLGETRNTLRTEDQWYHNCLSWIGRERVPVGRNGHNGNGANGNGKQKSKFESAADQSARNYKEGLARFGIGVHPRGREDSNQGSPLQITSGPGPRRNGNGG